MKERPILFSGEMVRAILDGRKTQTRRVIKPQPVCKLELGYSWHQKDKKGNWKNYEDKDFLKLSPFGQIGDRLWVRENYEVVGSDFYSRYFTVDVRYMADGVVIPAIALTLLEYEKFKSRKYPERITPGRFMYRSLSRIGLVVKGVDIERVQDITEEDAIEEGVTCLGDEYPRDAFERIWDILHGAENLGWDENPWVWVTEFGRIW